MKKIYNLTLVFLFLVSVSPSLLADAVVSDVTSLADDETVAVSLEDMSTDESLHYAFMYGLQAIIEDKCDGALLTFTSKNEYIAGYLTPNAPDDFCSRISPDTLVVSEPFTREGLLYIYSVLGDRQSMSTLMETEEEYLIGTLLFRPTDDTVLTPMWYAEIEKKIKGEAIARGINPSDVYLYLYQDGFDKDTVIASIAEGDATVEDTVTDAIKIQKNYQNSENANKVPLDVSSVFKIVIGAVTLVGVFILILFVLNFFEKKKKKE